MIDIFGPNGFRMVCLAVVLVLLGSAAGCRCADRPLPSELLGEAVKSGNVDKARRLLESGAPIGVSVEWKGARFPLAHVALDNDDYDMLELLLDHGADTQEESKQYATLLHAAARRGASARLVKLLLDHGASVYARDWADRTPLHWAAYRGQAEMVDTVLGFPRLLDCLDMDAGGYTACMLAAYEGHDRIARALIDHGANYDIYTAAMLGDAKHVKALVSSGQAAPLRVHPRSGLTPFVVAAHRRRKDVMAFLLAQGADIESENELNFYRTPLEIAIMAKDLEVTRFLLDNGANPDPVEESKCPRDDPGASSAGPSRLPPRAHPGAVVTAASASAPRILSLLETRGLAVTPCHRALAGDTAGVKKALDKAPELLNRPHKKADGTTGLTLLHYAVMNKHYGLAKYLLDQGAAVDGGKSAKIATPLHYAVRNGDIETVCLLLDHGADPKATDRQGKTPADWAPFLEPDVRELLERHNPASDHKKPAP